MLPLRLALIGQGVGTPREMLAAAPLEIGTGRRVGATREVPVAFTVFLMVLLVLPVFSQSAIGLGGIPSPSLVGSRP